MPVDAPVKENKSLDRKVAGAGIAQTNPPARLFTSLCAWFIVLALFADGFTGLCFPRNNSNAHRAKLEQFFYSPMHPDLVLLGSSVAMASSHTADKALGYVRAGSERSRYLGLIDLSNQIFERTGKRFSSANISCFGSMTSDTWMVAAKTVEFKKTPKIVIYETVSRDLFDASMAPIDESPYIRYLSSIHPKGQFSIFPKPVVNFIDEVLNSRIFTAFFLIFEDDQILTDMGRVRKQIDGLFCALSNLYGNRVEISNQMMKIAGGILHRNTSVYSASMAAKIENKKKNPFAKLTDAAPGTFEVNETPQLKRYEQERVYFSKILRLCKLNHIKLVVVNMPTQVGYKNLMPYSLKAICPKETYTLARQNGFEVIDLDNPQIFTPDDFIDLGHLNAKGALKVNRLLAEELARRHVLDDLQPTK